MARLLRCWYIKLLFLLLALFCVFVKHFTEVFPSALRDKNRVSKVALNLTNGDVSTYKKEKVFFSATNRNTSRLQSRNLTLGVFLA